LIIIKIQKDDNVTRRFTLERLDAGHVTIESLERRDRWVRTIEHNEALTSDSALALVLRVVG